MNGMKVIILASICAAVFHTGETNNDGICDISNVRCSGWKFYKCLPGCNKNEKCSGWDLKFVCLGNCKSSLQECCPGYTGDPPNCNPICSNDCGRGTCVEPDTCQCNEGWTGETCDTDIDECLTDNGGCDHNCHNSNGSYTCDCHQGFKLKSNGHSCNDIDECQTINGGCEHICNNSIGSYSCQCHEGFNLQIDRHNCEDIDECGSKKGGCEQECINFIGSYNCSCFSGYTLSNDSHSCEDIDECSLDDGMACPYNCSNTAGSYTCDCEDFEGSVLLCDRSSYYPWPWIILGSSVGAILVAAIAFAVWKKKQITTKKKKSLLPR